MQFRTEKAILALCATKGDTQEILWIKWQKNFYKIGSSHHVELLLSKCIFRRSNSSQAILRRL